MGRYEWTGPRAFADYANDREIAPGEVAEVDDELAAEFPAFVSVDEAGESGDESASSDEPADGSESDGDGEEDASADGSEPQTGEDIINDVIADKIDAGECPWCDDYDGEYVGQHASSAHPDAWDDYNE